MKFCPLSVQGAFEVLPDMVGDARGSFFRSYCADEFAGAGLPTDWPQMNISLTAEAGALRGLHFQRAPALEAKVVRCISGRAFDVAVDLRAGSATFGTWCAVTLASDVGNAIFIPAGCAHGFQALTRDCRLQYMHSHPYTPEHEGGVDALDPALAIPWPLPVGLRSSRDLALPPLSKVAPV